MTNATIKEPKPEQIPFNTTICTIFFEDNIRVQLFSIPQKIQANRIKIAP